MVATRTTKCYVSDFCRPTFVSENFNSDKHKMERFLHAAQWRNTGYQNQPEHQAFALSYIAEVFIFLYVGMDSLDAKKWSFINGSPEKSIWVSLILLVLVMVGRAAFILSLSFLSNLSRRETNEKVGIKQLFTFWWAGLVRGAVSVSLAYKKFTGSGNTVQPANALLITSTISVVLFSTVVFGLLTKPLIRWLLAQSDETGPSSLSSSMLPLLGNNMIDVLWLKKIL